MRSKTVSGALLVATCLLSGCSLLTAEKVNALRDQVEVGMGNAVAGDSHLACQYDKNQMRLGSVTVDWNCRQMPDGKLGGCTEPKLQLFPLK